MVFSDLIPLPDSHSTAQQLGHWSIGSTGATKDRVIIVLGPQLHRCPLKPSLTASRSHNNLVQLVRVPFLVLGTFLSI